jgi:hypothetical protein
MSVLSSGSLHIGETWTFIGTIRDANEAVVNLTGAVVKLKLIASNGNTLLLEAPSGGGSITSLAGGAYRFDISEAQQDSAGFGPGPYRFEIKAFFADTRTSVQNEGFLQIRPSLFKGS